MKEKEEFLKNEDDFKQYYRNAAYYYETGENKKFSDEDLFFVVESLSVGCHSYFYRKNSPVKLEKGKYPLTMEEFKEKVMELFFKTYHDPSLYDKRIEAIEDEGQNLWICCMVKLVMIMIEQWKNIITMKVIIFH